MKILIPELADTARLGAVLADLILSGQGWPPSGLILLQGGLGAGKTTLVRHLVENLPGGHTSEVCSPSFTLCNAYACEPPVLHFDLYRLEVWQDGEDLIEALQMAENGDLLLLVEWPERMKEGLLPPEFLHCSLSGEGQTRTATFKCVVPGQDFLRALAVAAEQAGLEIVGSSQIEQN
ncbi:MAG: tRNA (adenosine(37)-N6)-threonylcarbamoyltransferase complex ATPase subunit type 1 TsaE [Deltaproteobacteria bacterium]|jgi:tRNA threonylcarbamoyladenosine biosynthesis protein TsaE|nr:tRNA (adenosine(37)-N6)-threonylcarbamoyltransferase complex ATPase subunit type 1 TsaE [Deltaproteobacteria bacterium]